MTTRTLLPALALCSAVAVAGCRSHTPTADADWASVLELDGDRNDVLSRVAADTGVPAQVLYALAYRESRFEDPTPTIDSPMSDAITIEGDDELAMVVDPPDEIEDDVAPPEGLEDVQADIDANPDQNQWTLDAPVETADPDLDPMLPVPADTSDEEVGQEEPGGQFASMFMLTPDQITWAATTLGVDASEIGDDL